MHACSALALRGLKPEDHCHAWLTLGSYRATYNYFIQPVNSQIYWESTPYEKPVPPKVKRAPGRPKKARRKDGNEEPVCGSLMKKTYNDTQCGRCGLLGHNARSCMMQGVSRRPKENPGNVDAVDENAGNTPNEVPENAPNFVPGNAPNEVPENVVPAIDPNEVPANVVPENAPYFVQHNVVAHAGQSLAPRRYGLRGPVPSANRPKNTPMRGPAPAHPTPAGMIRVPYPTYGPPGSTQPQFMEFIPTPGFPKK
ncbi:uncharacterized protein [Medicago truncatula]|uniref:uncharacterized protein n=1 Tax=Medicago truncatula TaxID=3880 RepID=UPI001968170A|nr:uncharacterized protein LOC120580097 [Medicago truncatula]